MFKKFLVLATAVLGLMFALPISAQAVTPKCLTGATAAEDFTALKEIRAQIQAECACSNFIPTGKKNLHAQYVSCATSVVKTAVAQLDLRKQCKNLALYGAQRSTCGYPTTPATNICVQKSSSGKVSCKVAKSCSGVGKVSCPGFTNCIDAADTNRDAQVSRADSGQCNAPQDCAGIFSGAAANTRVDQASIQCFDTCTNPLNFQECIIGCAAGGTVLQTFIQAEFAACQARSTQNCEVLRDVNWALCATRPVPPQYCTDNCFGDPTCESKCGEVGNCTREVAESYNYCVASGGF